MATEETTKPRRTRKPAAPKAAPKPKAQTDSSLTEYTDDKGKKLTVQQLKNKLRGQAEREVLDTHKDEVIKITGALYEKHGLEYVRRLTDQEKAAAAIAESINQYPELLHLFAPAALAQLAKEQSIPLDPDNDPLNPDHPAGQEPSVWEEQQQTLRQLAAEEPPAVSFGDPEEHVPGTAPQVEAREGE